MKHLMQLSQRFFILISCGSAGLSLSCTQPGYRDMVYPGAQGQYTLKRVPAAEPAPAATPAATPTATSGDQANSTVVSGAPAGAPAAVPATPPSMAASDPELATVESLWPKLSPSDRTAVVDMTRHLATPRP